MKNQKNTTPEPEEATIGCEVCGDPNCEAVEGHIFCTKHYFEWLYSQDDEEA